jgi:hypothetical protein
VALFFIRTAGAWFHAFESNDPIFPAHDPEVIEIKKDLLGLFWLNPSTQAGVRRNVRDLHGQARQKVLGPTEDSFCA